MPDISRNLCLVLKLKSLTYNLDVWRNVTAATTAKMDMEETMISSSLFMPLKYLGWITPVNLGLGFPWRPPVRLVSSPTLDLGQESCFTYSIHFIYHQENVNFIPNFFKILPAHLCFLMVIHVESKIKTEISYVKCTLKCMMRQRSEQLFVCYGRQV
jgi:hypothetical protein